MLTKCYWLDAPDGRVMIGPWAVLIGRSPDCNLVLEGAEISRHHLLVRVGHKGAEFLPLARQPVRVNGAECRALTPLRAGAPVLTALRPGVWCGHALAEGERVTLADEARITYRAETLAVKAKQSHAGDETRRAEPPRFAVVVVLEFLPRGGQLTIEIGGELRTMALSERRCDMVACLLQPPTPFQAGEFIPEEVLCARVWPGEKNGRTELNSLLYRLRQALTDEGIDPAPLFERRGGGLRFCLAPRARVVVR